MSSMKVANHRWLSRLGSSAGLLLAALALMLVPAGPASAHAVLVNSIPGLDAVLTSAPAEVVLTFSESVRQVPGKIRVIGPDGKRVDRDEPEFGGAVVTIPVDQAGPRGTYLVSYRVISADSHPVAGAYTYSVGEQSTPPEDTGDAPVNSVVTNGLKVFKYLGYVGLMLLIGPVLMVSLLWPQRLSRHGPARLAWTGIGLIALATVAGLWLQVPYTAGGGPFEVSGSALLEVLGSTFGVAYLARLGILVAAAILLQPIMAGRAGRSDQVLLAILGVAGLVTWPLTGHPAASPVPVVSVLVDLIHLTSMAVWLGGLLVLAIFLMRQADERELGAILPIWSRWAALAISALLIAGTVQALIEVGTVDALISTGYGQLIIAKIVLFLLVGAVAIGSRELVRRRIAAERPDRLRRLIGVELVITAIVLAVTASLVQTTPARTAVVESMASGGQYFYTTVKSPSYSLEVIIDPAKRGSNSIHLLAYTLDGKPLPVVEWEATVALPAQDIEEITIPVLPLTDNHATGEIRLPTAGEWQFRFTLRISEIDQAAVTVTVAIK